MHRLTAEQRLERAHVQLMRHEHTEAYAPTITIGTSEIKDGVPTAYTNGRDCVYGREWVDSLPDRQFRGVIMHETLHKVLRHLPLYRHLMLTCKVTANMAMDQSVNSIIVEELQPKTNNWIELPEDGIYDPKYDAKNWDTEAIFWDMYKNKKAKEESSGGGKSGKSGESGSMDEHDWEASNQLSDEEQEQLARDLDDAAKQGNMIAGKRSGNVSRTLQDMTKVNIRWEDVVLRHLSVSMTRGRDIPTWRRPNRRWLSEDIYLPSKVSKTAGSIVFACDSSGSMSDTQISKGISTVMSMCKSVNPKAVHLMYWDCSVDLHETYTQGRYDSIPKITRPIGGGGTDPQCVADYINKFKLKPDCIIIFTDGYINSWGEGWNQPPLWVIDNGGRSCIPDVGTVVDMK